MGEKMEEQEKDGEKQMVKEEKEIKNDDNGVKLEDKEEEEKIEDNKADQKGDMELTCLKESDIKLEEKAEVSTPKEEITEDDEEDEEEEEEEVLPPPKVEVKELHSIPDFAAVCSFFNKFGLIGNLRVMNFGKLETLFTTYEKNQAPKELIDLHVFLLRRVKYQHATTDNWEKFLKKFLFTNPNTEEELKNIERYGGYAYIPIGNKVQILKALCESQIDWNVRLRDAIVNTCRTVDLRLIPVGTDRYGLSYWYQQDNDCNMRLYTEEPEDHCGSTWTLAAKSHEDLKTLIENLVKDDLGYDKKIDPLQKQKETDIQKGKIPVGHTDKKGTYLDTYIDLEQIRELKEAVLKVQTERMNRRMGTTPKVRKFVESEEEEEPQKVEEVDNEEDPEIPDDLSEGRRPRRGASIRAASNLKKVLGSGTTPKRAPKKVVEKKPSESDASENDDDEEDVEDEDNEDEDSEESDNDQEDSGDEFRPKSEKKKSKRKRSRKIRKPVDLEEEDDESNDEEEEVVERKIATGDNACGKCKTSTDWEVLLLCDCCDDAWHTYCLKPILWYVPDGQWFCPKCKHGRLIDRLKEVEIRYDADLKKKVIDDKKKQAAAERLRREMEYIGVSLNNIIQTQQTLMPTQPPSNSSESDDDGTQRKCKRKAVKKMTNWNKPKPQYTAPVFVGGRRSCRSRNKVDYKGSEFDQMIEEAVDNIDGAPPKEVKPPKEPELDENGLPKPKVVKNRKKPRLNDLDAVVDSDGSNNYEEEAEDSVSEEEEDDDAEIDSGSDFEDELPKTSKHRSRRSYVRRGASGKGRGRRKRSWSGSSTGEEEEDWIASDSDDGYTSKRKKKVKYESEVEEEEEDEDVEKTTTGRPLRKAVKASDRKVVVSDSEDDNAPPKKRAKKRGSDDEFEVENDDNEEEEEEEEEMEDDGDGDEDEEEEDDDSEGDSNESAPPKEFKRMAGAPPSQTLPVRPVKPQISAKRPRIKPEAAQPKSEDDEQEEEEEKPPAPKAAASTLSNSFFTPDNLNQIIPNPYLRPPPVTTSVKPSDLPVSNPYANIKRDDAKTQPNSAQYLSL